MEWFIVLEKVLYVLVSVVLYFVIKFLKDKGVIEKVQQIKVSDDVKENAARLSVLFAQQVYHDQGGKVKYEQAVSYLSEFLNDRGIKISESEMKLLIEASLLRAKKELSDVWVSTKG